MKAFCNSFCVFITIGPYHATGSPKGLPDIRRKGSNKGTSLKPKARYRWTPAPSRVGLLLMTFLIFLLFFISSPSPVFFMPDTIMPGIGKMVSVVLI